MASSTLTEYYKLSQFQPNDTANWLDDYNPDMQKIDTALHELSEQTAPLQDQIDALGARLDTEEAQSQLQGEQIVSLQTAMNTNTQKTNDAVNRVNVLTGRVDSVETLLDTFNEQINTKIPEIEETLSELETALNEQETINATQSTSIASNTGNIAQNLQSINAINNQLNDFENVKTTSLPLAPQFTGNLVMLTTFHNIRQLLSYGAVEIHDADTLEHVTDGDFTSAGYKLATAQGKIFNTHAPVGAEEQPNTDEAFIGLISFNEPDSLCNLSWHYSVANDETYIIITPVSGAMPNTGARTTASNAFIQD